MNKEMDYILFIDIFEQQCVVVKDTLQLPRLEDQMKVISIYQSLCILLNKNV